MTLCIAAFANEGWDKEDSPLTNSVLCSDFRVETDISGSETGFKMKKAAKHWAVLIAGNLSRADELLSIYCAELPQEPIEESRILDILRAAPQKLKRRLVEEYVQSALAISYDELLAKGAGAIPSGLFENIMSDISRLEIGCQMLLIPTGKEQKQNRIYCVDSNGTVFPQEHFSAIGTGAINATSWLHFREQRGFNDTNQTICHLLEAKRFSQSAPGVGKRTHLSILTHDGKLLLLQENEDIAEKIWDKSGPRKKAGMKLKLDELFFSSDWDEISAG